MQRWMGSVNGWWRLPRLRVIIKPSRRKGETAVATPTDRDVTSDARTDAQGRGMNAHVSAILLGVKDMEKSKRFYTEGLGWKIQHDYGISVFFVPHGGSLVGFYGREGLAADVGVNPQGSGFSGLALNYVVRSEKRVDEVMDEAKKAGARILKPAAKLQWGGYGGSFADPDGYVWRV